MESNDHVSIEQNHEMVLETARTLLKSGSDTNGPWGIPSLDIPMDFYALICSPSISWQGAWVVLSRTNSFPLFAQLVELVLTYESNITEQSDWHLFNWVSNLLEQNAKEIPVMLL